ncbi:MAG TPA: alkaline phosphatase family protein [Kiritimatiellia bacterium]|nr:alkaline phosphatase family protein [Kiritimatiellia bacterium]
MPQNKLLVVDVAALGWNQAQRLAVPGCDFKPAAPVFPAVTCVAQATMRTGALPSSHGLVGNGLWFPELKKVLFWEQSAALVEGPRIWEGFRARGKKVGMLFWQQSLGESVDLVLSPRPIHKHEGGMIQDCYSQPADLYARLCAKTGRAFNLMHYWGPLASRKSSEWITDATCAVMGDAALAPDLLFTYLPHLDYDLQRHGPDSPPAARAREVLAYLLAQLTSVAEANGYDWLIFGDYTIGPVTEPAVFPNRALRDAGLFWTRTLKGMAYPDFFNSPAFAVVDHEVAHVFTRDAAAKERAREVLAALPGVESVLEGDARRAAGVDHRRAGDLVLVAKRGAWFAYPWWTDRREAPDYATHIDIHNKPGYDPCELFFGWPPLSVSLNTAKVKGSHGRAGENDAIAWSTSLPLAQTPDSLPALSNLVRDFCG